MVPNKALSNGRKQIRIIYRTEEAYKAAYPDPINTHEEYRSEREERAQKERARKRRSPDVEPGKHQHVQPDNSLRTIENAVLKVTIEEFPSGDALVISGGYHPEFRSDYENGKKPLLSDDEVIIMTGGQLTIQYKGISSIGTAELKIKHLQFKGTVRSEPSQKAGDTKLLFSTFKKDDKDYVEKKEIWTLSKLKEIIAGDDTTIIVPNRALSNGRKQIRTIYRTEEAYKAAHPNSIKTLDEYRSDRAQKERARKRHSPNVEPGKQQHVQPDNGNPVKDRWVFPGNSNVFMKNGDKFSVDKMPDGKAFTFENYDVSTGKVNVKDIDEKEMPFRTAEIERFIRDKRLYLLQSGEWVLVESEKNTDKLKQDAHPGNLQQPDNQQVPVESKLHQQPGNLDSWVFKGSEGTDPAYFHISGPGFRLVMQTGDKFKVSYTPDV